MGLLERKVISVSVGVLLGSFIAVTDAKAEESYPVIYEKPSESREEYIMIAEEEDEYKVLPGDSLWDIAENIWGDSGFYMDLAECNRDIVPEPDLIYPGMILKVNRTGCIRREHGPAGVSMGEYSFDTPAGWTAGVLHGGDAWANFALFGGGMRNIVCLIQDKKVETIASTSDWTRCAERIKDYAEENYAGCVSDLKFEHYQVEDGEELYMYSFVYEIDMAEYGYAGSMEINVCAGLRMTERIQAEFVGFDHDSDVHDIVRYVSASFDELASDKKLFTVNDSNMAIVPSAAWETEGMFNSFAWIEEYFDSVLEEITGGVDEKEQNIRERLIGGKVYLR